MKKLILSLLACATVVAAQAQKNTAGSILVYGDLGIASHKDSATNATHTLDFNINPGVGYQFNKNWTVGIYGGYNSSSVKPDNIPRTNFTMTSVGVFARYNCQFSEIFSMNGQLNAGYITGNVKFDGNEITGSRYNGFEINYMPSIRVDVHSGFALNFGFGGLGFSTKSYQDQPSNTDNSIQDFHFTFGQQLNIGVSKNFGGHHAMGHGHHKGHHQMMDDTRRMDTSDDEGDDTPKKKTRKDDDE